MNEFTRNLKASDNLRRPKKTAKPWFFSFCICIGIIVVAIFISFAARVAYTGRTVALGKEAEKIRSVISEKEREIRNLNDRKEALRSKRYVDTKIAEYKLGLRIAKPSQIAYLRYGEISTSPIFEGGYETASSSERGNTSVYGDVAMTRGY